MDSYGSFRYHRVTYDIFTSTINRDGSTTVDYHGDTGCGWFTASIFPAVSARTCYTNGTRPDDTRPDEDGPWLTVTNPNQLRVLDGCTHLIGSIYIDSTFSSPFILNGIAYMEGTLSASSKIATLESIEMPDLEGLGILNLYPGTQFKSLLMPNLQGLGWGHIYLQADTLLDFGALREAFWFTLGGPVRNVSLPALEKAEILFINRLTPEEAEAEAKAEAGGEEPSSKPVPEPAPVPVDIHLPVLREAEWLGVRTYIRSLVTPKLEVIGSDGMDIVAEYADLPSIDFPSLTSIKGRLDISGYIQRINLGLANETSRSITINAKSPVEITSSLINAGDLNITGSIKALNLPSFLRAESLHINSTIKFHCTPALINLYRFRQKPREADFCDAESLHLAGVNPWADYSEPNDGSESTPSPSPTPEGETPSPSPSPSPTPSPTPGYWSPKPTPTPTPRPVHRGLGSGPEIVILGLFWVVVALSVVWFWMQGGKRRVAEEDYPVEKSQIYLGEEGGDVKEKEGLLLYHDGEDVDAPPPYAKSEDV
ncbi:hypothetical protein BJY04DRAFT_223175 [Aspergillus karnatakaensis]|uniref:uncharacterized protein n=1 Tax=Aspergillus karnatakaensis TaxID=1810916 RepID=UPI003CCCE8F4